MDPDNEGPLLPRSGSEEYRPYVGRVPEFKFWCADLQPPKRRHRRRRCSTRTRFTCRPPRARPQVCRHKSHRHRHGHDARAAL